jgi:hypothetical protein
MSDDERGETFVLKRSQERGHTPVEFSTLILGLASTALIHLGETPNPENGKSERDLVLARETLEFLTVLREKTRGNLSSEEERLFGSVLADLQIRFVEASKR